MVATIHPLSHELELLEIRFDRFARVKCCVRVPLEVERPQEFQL
jgi:hypothetical protein